MSTSRTCRYTGFGMSAFRYGEADRCLHCHHRAVIPGKADAEALARHSGERLSMFRCPAGNGWHLAYPAVETGVRE